MMRVLILLYLAIVSVQLFCQQLPTSTHYLLNRFAFNPAFAGIKPCSEFTLGNKQQWAGMNGAPSTAYANYHNRWNKKDKYPDAIHGYGIGLAADQIGFESRTFVRFAYAYHLKVLKNYRLSFGIYAGLQDYSFNLQEVNVPDKNIDPAIGNETNRSLIAPEVSPGMFFYGKNYFIGLSSFQIFPTRMYRIGTNQQRLAAHYFLMSGYRFRGQKIDYLPSFLMSFTPFAPPTVDFSLLIEYDQKVGLILGSKYLNSAYVCLNLNVGKKLTLGYAYEYALNEINRTNPSTNEIVLSFSKCYRQDKTPKIFCPAYQ